jgi:predicted alpha-1,2-mannosidase
MSNIYQRLWLLTAAVVMGYAALGQNLTRYVNPFIGTKSMGHTFPGACVPHGIVQLSPDTDTIPHNVNGEYQKDAYRYCAGYQYDDETIVGFSHTHLSGTGHSDLGDILLMPVVGEPMMNPGVADIPRSGYRSSFSHANEQARPGYYSVLLDDYGIRAELTATERVGVHKYTYPKGEKQQLILDLIHGIYNYDGKVLWANVRVENDTLLTGYRITNGWARTNYTYFAITFSKPVVSYTHVDREKPMYRGFWRKFRSNVNFPEMGGRKIVACFDFGNESDKPLEVKVALSAVSTSGALLNLKAEAAGKSFDRLQAEAQQKWERELSIIEAKGNSDQLSMLYTSLYHTLINPSVYMDHDGRYRGIDHEIHQADGFTSYTVFSVWDTYRALHPLFNLINRDRNKDMVRSMLEHYRQSVHGALPVWSHMGNENWCMIGYHGVSVVTDALIKGLVDDRSLALKAMNSSANIAYYDNTADYLRLGYVPFDANRSGSSITMEYAYDDWAIYRSARLMGNDSLAQRYRARAMSYRNVFDPQLGFARGRMADGSWKPNFSLLSTNDEGFIEGNSWNYSFYVPHDVRGLMQLMGGDKVFTRRLDSLFTMHLPDEFFATTEDVTPEGILGCYVHGNEPSHHVPYLYSWTSQPWKTQHWVREIMNRMYRNTIDGLCGNDDCGQMSAWYVFSAMGFYPVCPGSDQYVIGAPYLPYMKVKVGEGKFVEIRAPKVSNKNCFIRSVKLNGKPYAKAYFTYNDLKDGAVIDFEMASKPNRSRIFGPNERPYSLSEEK